MLKSGLYNYMGIAKKGKFRPLLSLFWGCFAGPFIMI
jgi:hypothetical protein